MHLRIAVTPNYRGDQNRKLYRLFPRRKEAGHARLGGGGGGGGGQGVCEGEIKKLHLDV